MKHMLEVEGKSISAKAFNILEECYFSRKPITIKIELQSPESIKIPEWIIELVEAGLIKSCGQEQEEGPKGWMIQKVQAVTYRWKLKPLATKYFMGRLEADAIKMIPEITEAEWYQALADLFFVGNGVFYYADLDAWKKILGIDSAQSQKRWEMFLQLFSITGYGKFFENDMKFILSSKFFGEILEGYARSHAIDTSGLKPEDGEFIKRGRGWGGCWDTRFRLRDDYPSMIRIMQAFKLDRPREFIDIQHQCFTIIAEAAFIVMDKSGKELSFDDLRKDYRKALENAPLPY